tara:strand:+ start:74 stop:421 length:348 start_codon:yes stop_codon:yes gene_type:complete
MRRFQEADATDSSGRVLVSPGLKVRHRDSQFEYTVDNVFKDEDKLKIVLKLPEEPRFEPTDSEPEVLSAERPNSTEKKVMYEVDPSAVYFVPEDDDEADTLTVTQEEFEEEYEVK